MKSDQYVNEKDSCAFFYRKWLLYCMSMFQEEQFRLKQELSELAISLNMEAQKGRQVANDHNK